MNTVYVEIQGPFITYLWPYTSIPKYTCVYYAHIMLGIGHIGKDIILK